MIARRFRVVGSVQGVGYRAFTVSAARLHRIAGWVRNRPDGSVEVLAEGEAAEVEAFRRELAAGPRFARVAAVHETVEEPAGTFNGFSVTHGGDL